MTDRIIRLFLFMLFMSINLFGQSAIHYSYNQNGNRIQRKLLVIPPNNNSNRVAGNTPAKPSENYNNGVFPNPVQDHLKVNISPTGNLSGDGGNAVSCAIVLSDESGRVLISLQNQPAQSEVDMRPYQPGVYYLSITPAGGKVTVYKILKGG